MSEIINTLKQHVPAMRFIGKKYSDFSHWGEWFENDWFGQIETVMGDISVITDLWDNGGGYVGLERHQEGAPFEYWIGMFTPAGTEVPEDFQYIDFSESDLGICWIYGKEEEVHDTSGCQKALKEQEIEILPDQNGVIWAFENCLCPRYTTPDEKGNIILDYCYYLNKDM